MTNVRNVFDSRTFVIDMIAGEIWLCAEDGTGNDPVPLAKFNSVDSVRKFNNILALAKVMAKATGQMGI